MSRLSFKSPVMQEVCNSMQWYARDMQWYAKDMQWYARDMLCKGYTNVAQLADRLVLVVS